ncbi:MAG: flagellar export chaperone FliS [Myxococcales bacterium]|nr:flagellar export chaperone FliS [Myxococcales bacterium]MCB9735014.1 flagellar export chaperone FliS [Deltaproteobacteria bacterium]
MNRKLKAYQRVQITTASPAEVIVLLYDGLTRFCVTARRAIESKMFADAGEALDKAHAIIVHLIDSLDDAVNPELTAHLRRMYFAWSRALMKAQISQDLVEMDEIIEQMRSLGDAWRQASQTALAEGA